VFYKQGTFVILFNYAFTQR